MSATLLLLAALHSGTIDNKVIDINQVSVQVDSMYACKKAKDRIDKDDEKGLYTMCIGDDGEVYK